MAKFDNILSALRAAGEATRLRALLLLAEGELTVSELTQILGQSQPRVSRHLKILSESRLVERHQEGAWTFYRLSDTPMLAAIGVVAGETAPLLPAADRDSLATLRLSRADAAAAYFAKQAKQWAALRALYIDESAIEERLLELSGPDADTFLDLGTGTGQMLVLFRNHYRRGVGVDSSAEMLTVARARLGEAQLAHAQVRRGDFLDDPLPEDVDIVCLHHVLHFLVSPGEAIQAAASSLSDEGRVLIADFAPHDYEILRETHAHRRLGFSDEEIGQWAKNARLKITATEQLNPPVDGGLTTKIWRLEFRASTRTLPSHSGQFSRNYDTP